MSAIFLSYRRDDSSGYAGRLFDNLAERFGRERVFMDIETLEPGMDFVAGIDRAIESCGAVIAMIGPNWVEAEDRQGRRRLDDPHDFIRLEITTALTRGVRVIPVLVHHATMPPEQELPEPLRPLCRLQAFEISDNRWEFDVHRLADVLEPLIAEPAGSPPVASPVAAVPAGVAGTDPTSGQKSGGRSAGWLAVVAAVVLAAGGGTWWFGQSTLTGQAPILVDAPVSSPSPAAARDQTAVTAVARPKPSAAPVPTTETIRPEPPTRSEPVTEASPDPGLAEPTEPIILPLPPGPSPDELRQREIAELIQAAEIDLAELRLTRPADSNAYERFRRVLELEPDNRAAREGLIAITERYHGLVEDALNRGALDDAQRHLDSARMVDPRADWLTPLQHEIEKHRRDVAQPEQRPEPASRPRESERADCLSACEARHRACRTEVGQQTEADCLRSRAETCEQRYQSCMSDTGKMFMGEVSHRSECVGVHAQCTRSAAMGCTTALQIAVERCDTEFDSCSRRCRGRE